MDMKKYGTEIVVGVCALIVGFGIGAWWKTDSIDRSIDADQARTALSAADEQASSTFLSAANGDFVDVEDQKAGNQVTVTSALFSQKGWVVIAEDDHGKPARILGAQEFVPGMATGTVDLLKPTIAGGSYHAMIYIDNGDNIFDYKVDAPLTDSSGNTVESLFSAY